jgi:hypothetical protein
MSKEHFEVQHWTVADGWVNCWTMIDHEDNEHPQIYDTFKEAMDDLDDLFDEVLAEFAAGHREDKYDDSDYRIVKFVSGDVVDIMPYTYLPPQGDK